MSPGRSERARAIPLATLVCIVAVLVVLRARESTRSSRPHETRVSLGASRDAGVDAGSLSIARAVVSVLADASRDDAGAPHAPHMLHGDPHHTARAAAVGPMRANLRWTTAIGGPIEAQVVASPDERTLYVASLDGALTALDAETGAKIWSVPLGDRAYSTPCVSAAGTIYVGSDAKRFYAIAPSGTVLWKLETNAEADTGAVMVGNLVVFAAGASVFAVRPGGDVAWRFDARKKIFTAPAVGEGSAIIVGSQDHHVYAISRVGAPLWNTDLGADVDGAAAIDDEGAITVGTDAGEVVHLSTSGTILWRTQVGGFVRGTLSVARNGDLLAGVYGPTPGVVRLAPDGSVTGSFSIHGTGSREFGVHGAPLEDATGALFFGAQDDDVHALGPGGAWEWTFSSSADIDAPLTLLATGALVAASDDGNVYLLAP